MRDLISISSIRVVVSTRGKNGKKVFFFLKSERFCFCFKRVLAEAESSPFDENSPPSLLYARDAQFWRGADLARNTSGDVRVIGDGFS